MKKCLRNEVTMLQSERDILRGQLAAVTAERDKWKREHRAMSKGAQTNAEVIKLQAAKMNSLQNKLDTAKSCITEIRALMPKEWECYGLPHCVLMLIQERDRLRECGRIVGGVSGDALKQLQDVLAERDELQNELARAQDSIVRHMSARSDLMAERDALLADEARLDWLEQRGLVVWHDGQTLRESIDAAKEVSRAAYSCRD